MLRQDLQRLGAALLSLTAFPSFALGQVASSVPVPFDIPYVHTSHRQKSDTPKHMVGDVEEMMNEGEEAREWEREEEELETERDAFTPRTRTLKRRVLALESSYSFIHPKEGKNRHSFPELLVRYGLTDNIELRVGWNQEVGGGELDSSGAFLASSEQTILYGAKFYLAHQNGLIPESSIIAQGHTPTHGENSLTRLHLGYVFGWELPNRWKLDSAIRYVTDIEGEDHFATWAPSVVLRVPVGERAHFHAEYFGLFSDQKESNTNRQFLSGGVSFNPVPRLEVGVRSGLGLNDQSADFFINAGFGWRF